VNSSSLSFSRGVSSKASSSVVPVVHVAQMRGGQAGRPAKPGRSISRPPARRPWPPPCRRRAAGQPAAHEQRHAEFCPAGERERSQPLGFVGRRRGRDQGRDHRMAAQACRADEILALATRSRSTSTGTPSRQTSRHASRLPSRKARRSPGGQNSECPSRERGAGIELDAGHLADPGPGKAMLSCGSHSTVAPAPTDRVWTTAAAAPALR